MNKQIWKDIKGYNGLYKVNDKGQVKSVRYGREKILSPLTTYQNNYQYILCLKGKREAVFKYQLIEEYFPNKKTGRLTNVAIVV